jgi:hypothetical protein
LAKWYPPITFPANTNRTTGNNNNNEHRNSECCFIALEQLIKVISAYGVGGAGKIYG